MNAAYHPRGRELKLWSDILGTAADGRGGVLAVSAAPGIGKSRLLAVLGEQAADHGFRLLRGVGRRLQRTTSHSGTLQIFETVAARDVPGLYDGVASLAQPLLEQGQTGADPFAQTHALFWCLANLAAKQPVAMFLDDAQWLDAATTALLAYAVERADELPIAIAVAARPGAFRTDPRLCMIRNRATDVCDLTPLTDAQVQEVLDELIPDAEPSVLEEVASMSAGNPLLLHQLARAMSTGAIDLGNAATNRDGILATYVSARMAELHVPARALLNAAAVLGNGSPWEQAATVAGLTATSLVEAQNELHDSQLVLVDRRAVAFPHALVSDAVLGQLSPTESSALHRRAADVVDQGGRGDLAAAHLLLTHAGEDESTVEVLLRQAQVEHEHGAPDNAVAYLRRAAAERTTEMLAARVALALGEALLATGAVEEASGLLVRAAHSAAPDQRFAAARAAARALMYIGDPVSGARLLEELGAELGADNTEGQQVRAELTGIGQTAHALASAPRDDVGLTGFDRRAALAMEAYDHTVVWHGRAADTTDQLMAFLPDALESLGVNSPLIGMMVMGLVGSGGPGWSTARAAIVDASSAARSEGSTVALATFSSLSSRLSLLEGRLRDAQADGALAVDLAARANPAVLPFAISALVMTLIETGQTDAAEAVLAEHGFASGDVPPTAMAATLLLSRVMLRRAQGRLDEALGDIARIAPFGRGRGPWPSSWTPEIVRTFVVAGKADRASEIAHQHLHDAEEWGAPLHVAEALLLQAEMTPSIALLERAQTELDEFQAPLVRARLLLALGGVHRRAGQRTLAQDLLLKALELADTAPAPPLVGRIRTELAACGLRPRRVAQSGVAALTASELRIARLACAGRTNAEIAQELYLSVKTVEKHLTHAYSKLGISSRRELAALRLNP